MEKSLHSTDSLLSRASDGDARLGFSFCSHGSKLFQDVGQSDGQDQSHFQLHAEASVHWKQASFTALQDLESLKVCTLLGRCDSSLELKILQLASCFFRINTYSCYVLIDLCLSLGPSIPKYWASSQAICCIMCRLLARSVHWNQT